MPSKFCQLWDLKKGFQAYLVIILMLRLCSFVLLPCIALHFNFTTTLLVALYCAWTFASCAITIIALIGVYRGNSQMLYPNLVILPIETFFAMFVGILFAILIDGLYALWLLVAFIHLYHFLCLLSLYKICVYEENTKANGLQNNQPI